MTAEREGGGLATRLRHARKMRSMRQEDLAVASGLVASAISQFERGSRRPSMDSLKSLCDALNVSADFLLGYTDRIIRLRMPTRKTDEPIPDFVARLLNEDPLLSDGHAGLLARMFRAGYQECMEK